MLVATFDIGTTAVKAVAVRDDGEPFFTGSQVIHTIEKMVLRNRTRKNGTVLSAPYPMLLQIKYRPKTFPLLFFRSDAGCDTSWK